MIHCELYREPWGKSASWMSKEEWSKKFICSCTAPLQCGGDYKGRCFCGAPKFAPFATGPETGEPETVAYKSDHRS